MLIHSAVQARRRPAILLAAIALLALAVPAAADAKVTVMTRNVFLGADLGPAIESTSIEGAVDAGGVILNEVDSTKFAERAVPLAKEIRKAKPHLVGLQEVALWREQTPSDYMATPATDVRYDFLDLLQAELDKKGPKYKVVHVQQEFDEELPADEDGSNATGNGPFAFAGADLDGRLTMRDVILARRGGKVDLGKTASAHYTTLFEPTVGGALSIPVERGWQSVEARVKRKSGGGKGKGRGASVSKRMGWPRKFRFVNTHLEAFGEKTIREAQAKELIAGPLDTRKQVILVGDLNSGVARHNEPAEPGDELAFQAFKAAGFKDNGAVHTATHDDLFDPADGFDHTVDHVLTNPGLRTKRAFVTGDDPNERTPSGLWPSDHGGVVSKLQFRCTITDPRC